MNKELQDYYEARFSTMGGQGWKDLIEDVERMIESTNTLAGVDDEKKLHFKRGELSILIWLKTLKQVSEQSYEELKNEDTERL
jgi:hypothetical protein